MKKYTIKDNLGNKKTIYADNLAHALSLTDSTYELYLGSNLDSDDWAQIHRTIKRYGLYVGEYRKGMETITVHGDRKNIEKLLEYFGHHKGYSKEYNKIKDSIRDEASLATTINALVNDEKAAIDAYNVAIKNLEGSIDDTARQVLINVRDDERRHVENLYAILNGQVTEKNLEDSKVKDDELEGKYHTKYGDKLIISKINASTYSYFDVDTKTSIRVSINALKEDIKAKRLIKDSKIADAVQSAETYANTGWIENKLASDLISEGQKNNYDFDAVLKKFDSLSKQILAVVKNALDNARKEIVDYKSRY